METMLDRTLVGGDAAEKATCVCSAVLQCADIALACAGQASALRYFAVAFQWPMDEFHSDGQRSDRGQG